MVTRLLIALAVLSLAPDARADDALARARADKAALRYAQARDTLDSALRAGGNRAEQLTQIYRLLGEVTAGLDDPAAAQDYFLRLLALDPEATLPAGASPKIKEPFDAAAAVIARLGPLSVRHQVTGSRSVVLIVDSDPVGQVAKARARYKGSDGVGSVDVAGDRRIEVRLPPPGPYQVVLVALDAYGNELAVLGSDAVPIALGGGEVSVTVRRSVWSSPWPWAGIAAGLAGAGAVFGIVSRRAEDDLAELNRESSERPFEIDFGEADDLKTRADRFALAANIGFGAAAAAAIVSAIFAVRGQPAAVTPVVGDGAAGAGVMIRF